jgi:hypothetical protein
LQKGGYKLNKIKQIFLVASCNFRTWHKNPRIIVAFCLAFILSFMLSNKIVTIAVEKHSLTQAFEVFIWTFGDSNSIMLVSLLMIILFADMPFISSGTPFFLMRTKRYIWLLGQELYIIGSTFIMMLFILLSTMTFSMSTSFPGNQWSQTAAILGYSKVSINEALPNLLKTLEYSLPYETCFHIFLLMLFYTILIVSIMLVFNLWKGPIWGNVSVIFVNLFGMFLKPDLFIMILKVPQYFMYKVNVAVAWASPLNHATYHMHNFGYDHLPKLWQSYLIFFGLIIICFVVALRIMKRYSFNFTGTED